MNWNSVRTRCAILGISVLLALQFVLGCTENPPTDSVDTQQTDTLTPAQLTAIKQDIVENTNDFAFKLFKQVCARTAIDSNVFLSPLSASYALALTANGADGATRDSMLHALSLDNLDIDEVNAGYQSLARSLTTADPLVIFTIANSLWARQGKALHQEYIDQSREYYDARVQELDISQPWAADTINQWVKDNTNNKIDEIVKPPLDFAALLLNAIYFKGNWRYPFDTADTREWPFRLVDGTTKNWDIMWLSNEDILDSTYPNDLNPDVKAFETLDLAMISLPYGDEGFEMLIVVPDSQTTIDEFVSDLNPQTFNLWLQMLSVDRFDLALPRLKFGFEASLNDPLKTLGMNIAFDPSRADFGRMFVDDVGWIDEVKQKSFVQVDEKGTEAAVVTQVIFPDSLPPFIDATRPFLFMIRESQTGAILFMAKIAEPVWED